MDRHLTFHQKYELEKAILSRVCCLTGGPGTGKTFTLAAYLRDYVSGPTLVCAPTGKATSRCREALAAYDVYGPDVSTIHTALNPLPTKDGWVFQRGLDHPLGYKNFVIDESSMIDARLMACFLEAVPPGSNVMFVGDINQLPPVGHGMPFRDMMAAGIPTGHLTEIHRFAGRIATVCDAIHRGGEWHPSPKDKYGDGYEDKDYPENFLHFEKPDAATSLHAIQRFIAVCNERGFHPIHDVQVLCPVHQSGSINRHILNKVLRAQLNPGHAAYTGKFAPGDKVICLTNGLAESVDDEAIDAPVNSVPLKNFIIGVTAYVANGEVGMVEAIDNTGMVLSIAGYCVFVPFKDFDKYDLAFAITCHKSQGSQWPVVISVIDDCYPADMVCSRQYWYTALSRASRITATVGRRSVLDRHCEQDIKTRKTFLKEEIESWITNSRIANSA